MTAIELVAGGFCLGAGTVMLLARDRVKRFAENATPLMEHASGYTKTGGRGNKLHDNNNVVFGNGTEHLLGGSSGAPDVGRASR